MTKVTKEIQNEFKMNSFWNELRKSVHFGVSQVVCKRALLMLFATLGALGSFSIVVQHKSVVSVAVAFGRLLLGVLLRR